MHIMYTHIHIVQYISIYLSTYTYMYTHTHTHTHTHTDLRALLNFLPITATQHHLHTMGAIRQPGQDHPAHTTGTLQNLAAIQRLYIYMDRSPSITLFLHTHTHTHTHTQIDR